MGEGQHLASRWQRIIYSVEPIFFCKAKKGIYEFDGNSWKMHNFFFYLDWSQIFVEPAANLQFGLFAWFHTTSCVARLSSHKNTKNNFYETNVNKYTLNHNFSSHKNNFFLFPMKFAFFYSHLDVLFLSIFFFYSLVHWYSYMYMCLYYYVYVLCEIFLMFSMFWRFILTQR